MYSGSIPLELEENVADDDDDDEFTEGDSVNTADDTIAVLNLLNIPDSVEFVGEDPKEVLPSLDNLRSLVLVSPELLRVALSAGLFISDWREGLGGGAEELDLLEDGLGGAADAVVNNGDEIEGSCSASIISLLILLDDDARTGLGGAAGLAGGVAAAGVTAGAAGDGVTVTLLVASSIGFLGGADGNTGPPCIFVCDDDDGV